jgi:hypothetical protein
MSTNTDPSLVHNRFFEILFLKLFNVICILECVARCSCLRHGATRREVSGSIPGRSLGNFKVIIFLLSAFSSCGVHSACNKYEYQGISVVSSAAGRRAEDCTVLTVPNLNVRVETEHSIPFQNLNAFLGKVLPLLLKQCVV